MKDFINKNRIFVTEAAGVLVLTLILISLVYKNPVDLVGLTDKYEDKIATVSAELEKEREYTKHLQEVDTEHYLEMKEYLEARCVCKNYSGETDDTGMFLEAYPENRQLTKEQICQ
jgi:hypothetical protein